MLDVYRNELGELTNLEGVVAPEFEIRAPDRYALRTLRDFRKRELGKLQPNVDFARLLEDKWDMLSIHVFVTRQTELIGCVRFTKALKGRLPINDIISNLNALGGEIEISRGLIAEKHRGSKAIVVLIKGMYEFLLTHRQPLLIDSLVFRGAGVRVERYLRAGFYDAGIKYYDARYNHNSKIFRTINNGQLIFLKELERTWKNYL